MGKGIAIRIAISINTPIGNQGCQKVISNNNEIIVEMIAAVRQIVLNPAMPIIPRPARTKPRELRTTKKMLIH